MLATCELNPTHTSVALGSPSTKSSGVPKALWGSCTPGPSLPHGAVWHEAAACKIFCLTYRKGVTWVLPVSAAEAINTPDLGGHLLLKGPLEGVPQIHLVHCCLTCLPKTRPAAMASQYPSSEVGAGGEDFRA